MFTNECFSDRVSTWAEGEEVSQMQTATDREGGGGRVSKITKRLQTSFMDDSLFRTFIEQHMYLSSKLRVINKVLRK